MGLGTSPTWQGLTLNLLRIIAGFLFLQHGAQKLFGVLGREEPVQLVSLIGLAAVLEFFGGLLILFGVFTRPVAFVLAGEMAVAYWMVHGPRAFWPIMNQGELAALYCFVFLFLFTHGGGNVSVDTWLRKGKA
ncbi:MAG: DoxX family protein [Acidobacteria bacterium]|nr:DoxX family protein [Acidobacteriota bacterium]